MYGHAASFHAYGRVCSAVTVCGGVVMCVVWCRRPDSSGEIPLENFVSTCRQDEYLRKLIELEDFKANHVNTGWLESVMAASSVRADKPDPLVVVRCVCRLFASRGLVVALSLPLLDAYPIFGPQFLPTHIQK